MKAKPDKPKTRNEIETRFYRFATALMAVPRKEVDKELAKHETRQKKTPKRR